MEFSMETDTNLINKLDEIHQHKFRNRWFFKNGESYWGLYIFDTEAEARKAGNDWFDVARSGGHPYFHHITGELRLTEDVSHFIPLPVIQS